jgi:hypothetical protein
VNYGNISGGKMMLPEFLQPICRKRKRVRNRKTIRNLKKFSDTGESGMINTKRKNSFNKVYPQNGKTVFMEF